jgi:iron complex transport system ATP-binding protein
MTPSTNQPNKSEPAHLAIDLHGVGVRCDDRWILHDINWQVKQGEFAAVLGPNGSGKSTLGRIIAGHLWPTAGRCTVLGQTFGEANLPELRKSIRLVQTAGPYDVDPNLTAMEVVLTGAFGTIGLYDKPKPQDLDNAGELLNRVGLSRVTDHKYSTLSSGERVRSLIARALMTRPRLLILDEPTAGLDLLAREQVLAMAAGLAGDADSPAIVLVTHHVEELPPITSHVLLLKEGKSAAQGKPADILQSEILSDVYGVKVDVRFAGGRYYLEVHPTAWDELSAKKQCND